MMNQTQLVRSAINLFIVVVVIISLVQEFTNLNKSPLPQQPETVTTSTGETVPLEPTGPVIPGIKLLATDRYNQPLKELLAKNKLNVEISSYTFEGNLYWLNMAFNWGHIVLIYFLLSKYKMETDDGAKKKIMIGGAVAVLLWFYVSAQFRPQALAVEVHGSKVYDKDYMNESEIVEVLNEYEIEIDDLNEAKGMVTEEKVDAWELQQKRVQDEKAKARAEAYEEEIVVDEEIF